jgi:hypothetical protein
MLRWQRVSAFLLAVFSVRKLLPICGSFALSGKEQDLSISRIYLLGNRFLQNSLCILPFAGNDFLSS